MFVIITKFRSGRSGDRDQPSEAETRQSGGNL